MPRILVVDDQPENLGIIQSTLENFLEDCVVLGSLDSNKGLAVALDPASNLDLIITDVKMPNLDGFSFCQEYREKVKTPQVPILMISGIFTESKDRARGLQAGADGYLSKPYRLDELLAQVNVLLRIKDTEDRLRAREQDLRRELANRGGALVASENRFEILFESSPTALWVVGEDLHLLDANSLGSELLGQARSDIGHFDLLNHLPPEAHDPLQSLFPLWIKASGSPTEILLQHPEKGEVDLEVFGQPIQYGGITTVLVHLHDITQRKVMERRSRSSQTLEAIGRLAGGVAHDFNNLLTSILGFSHLLKDDLPDEAKARGDLGRIIHAAETACGLTRKLMVFGQRQILPLHPMDLNLAVADGLELLRRTIGENIELVPLMEDDLPYIHCDEQLVEHMLADLVTNARDSMVGSGKIIITTAREEIDDEQAETLHTDARAGVYSTLTVTDHGRGIPEAIRDDIFEPFFSTKKTETRTTGLGLSTAYGIVKKAKGFILLESVEGEGTTVQAWFPCASAPAGSRGRSAHGLPIGGRETILVAEDEEHVLRLCVRLLDRLGYTVLKARNGSEAIAVAAKHDGTIHLLLTDVVMPVMGGPETAKVLLETRPELAVLYTSGYTADPLPFDEDGQAKVPFLMKPYTGDTLARKVRDVLDLATFGNEA